MDNFLNNLTYNITNAGVAAGVTPGAGYVNRLADSRDSSNHFYYDKDMKLRADQRMAFAGSVSASGLTYSQQSAQEQSKKGVDFVHSANGSSYSYARQSALDQLKAVFFGNKDKACRFYYDKASGGIFNIMLRALVGSGYALAQKAAIDQLSAAFFGGKDKGLGNAGVSTQTQLIEEANHSDNADQDYRERKYGVMKVNDGKNAVVAVDFCGNWCPDAVMLGIPVRDGVFVKQNNIVNGFDPKRIGREHKIDNSFKSDTLVWYDPTALVTVQSQKNYILTKVNGRDYSRKELVSNGDIEFSITGRINSNLPDVYPTKEIQKFIQIMQYKGLVKINSQIIDQFHIERVFIKDYSLPQREGYRNIQEYTINCVGSMPTRDVRVQDDTIIALDDAIYAAAEAAKSPWQQMLDNAVQGLKGLAVSKTASALSSVGGILNNKL